MTEPTKKTHPFATVGGLIGAAGGWALSQYCGPSVWIPGVAAGLLLLLFAKTAAHPKWFAGAIAVTSAHVIWFVVGSALAGVWSPTALDIFFLSACVIWLWFRPGLAAALFLGMVQAVSLAMNILALASATVGDVAHRALTAHCIFRIVAVVCLVYGYVRMRRATRVPPATSTDTPI